MRFRIVLPVIAALAVLVCAFFYFNYSSRKREGALKQNLFIMRQAIDNYTMDKQKAPQSLEDLVEAHYISEIPIDPVCGWKDWNPHFGDTVLTPEQTNVGLDDVFARCDKIGSNGKPHNTW